MRNYSPAAAAAPEEDAANSLDPSVSDWVKAEGKIAFKPLHHVIVPDSCNAFPGRFARLKDAQLVVAQNMGKVVQAQRW